MTNEELCCLIQQGDNGLLPVLWDQVRKFIAYKAKAYYDRYCIQVGTPCSWDSDDLTQQGYFAVVDAVSYYKPTSGYKFTTFMNMTLKNAFRVVAGIRSSKRNPLDKAYSLDAPFGEDGSLTMLEAIRDLMPGDGDPSVEVIESIYNQQLRKVLDNALDDLSPRRRKLLILYFYFGINMRDIAANESCAYQNISVQIDSALNQLRSGKHRRILAEFLYPTCKNGDINVFASCGEIHVADRGIDPDVEKLLIRL